MAEETQTRDAAFWDLHLHWTGLGAHLWIDTRGNPLDLLPVEWTLALGALWARALGRPHLRQGHGLCPWPGEEASGTFSQ